MIFARKINKMPEFYMIFARKKYFFRFFAPPPPRLLRLCIHFLPLIVWVYLHSHFRGGLRKTNLFCNRVRIGRSRSSKVVDFGTNRKGVCDFLLIINSNFGPILHRFWDTATYWLKIANFSYPTLILGRGAYLPEHWSPWAIRRWRFRDPSLRRFHSVPACDGQTDGRTNSAGLPLALAMLTVADALKMDNFKAS